MPPLPTQKGNIINWGNVLNGSLSYCIKQILENENRFIVLITADPQSAFQLERELKVYLKDKTLISHFPDWETLPYDHFSPHQDIISERLATLAKLPNTTHGILIAPITTLCQRVAPSHFIHAHRFDLKIGDKIDIPDLRAKLIHSGYRAVSQVISHGEFAIRGALIDLFPMGLKAPIRIDLFGNEIETLRYFDTDTQRSLDKIDKMVLLPAHEFPLDEHGIKQFRSQWRIQFSGNPLHCPLYEQVSQGASPPGIEYYLPLFYESVSTLFDFLPKESLLIRHDSIKAGLQRFWQEASERYEQRRHDISRPILPPESLYLKENELFGHLKAYPQIKITDKMLPKKAGAFNLAVNAFPDLSMDAKKDEPLERLQQFVQSNSGQILFCAESPGRKENLLELLNRINIHPTSSASISDFLTRPEPFQITVASIDHGLQLPDSQKIIIAESQLYGQTVMQRRRRQATDTNTELVIRNLAELIIGAPIVHIEHGIGRYQGLTVIQVGENCNEYLALEYAGKDKLYVPVSSLHMISQYSGSQPELAPINKLGTDHWEKAKAKAKSKAFDVAAELLNIYSQREAKKGFSFPKPDENYFKFARSFPFEETPDQTNAIADVLRDMENERPMDRLICGDVGFGKTEVALRAAFLAVMANKQVALLVPTTLLAQQHYETFKDRFADWPIRIEVISRFQNKKETDKIIADLKESKVDIIIGTHKLIQPDVKFKDLGLLIIDEEHRFGVKQKEKLKSLRANVDIVTLTATPIPRTLNMALSSIRDLSIIATPPAKRLSIKTFIHEYDFAIVQEAILREIMRGGQVYYLHNHVDTIDRIAREIQEKIPQARVNTAHGQMHERELERIMTDFYHQKSNVLVCTTIIETGIDIPSANTIIIERADKFGLAQLHQLRGRVGRSHHQAYAHCLTAPHKTMTRDAIKRLEALTSLEDLGSGFVLATHDLEIRGAGELLGADQSGHVELIGFSMYMELLEKAVQTLKQGKTIGDMHELTSGAEIDLQIPAFIPDDYLPDVHTRLVLYKRIASAKQEKQLTALKIEMIDRFGLLPAEVKNLFKITELKIKADPIGIRKIEVNTSSGRITFVEKPNFDPMTIINLIKNSPQHYQIVGSDKLKITFNMEKPETRIQVIERLLETFKTETLTIQ